MAELMSTSTIFRELSIGSPLYRIHRFIKKCHSKSVGISDIQPIVDFTNLGLNKVWTPQKPKTLYQFVPNWCPYTRLFTRQSVKKDTCGTHGCTWIFCPPPRRRCGSDIPHTSDNEIWPPVQWHDYDIRWQLCYHRHIDLYCIISMSRLTQDYTPGSNWLFSKRRTDKRNINDQFIGVRVLGFTRFTRRGNSWYIRESFKV